jgi:transposase
MNLVAAQRKYPVELQERAVAMVRDLGREPGGGRGAVARVAGQLGVHPEALRYWVRRADGVVRGPGSAAGNGGVSPDTARVVELEKEIRELRRANEILRLAAAFFAREIDPRPPS